MKLVFIENNRPVTDTLIVSANFSKRHDAVMRDVRDILEKLNSEIPNDSERTAINRRFASHNFVETPYVSEQNNQTYKKFNLTEEAFNLVVMGFTGFDAMTYKVAFINEFIRMRDELNKPQFTLPQTHVQALEAYLQEMKKNEALEQQNAYKDGQLRLQEPKVALYDVAMAADGVQPVGTVAKELGLGRTRLFALLREKKVLRQNNEPYQEFIERGYFKLRMYTITHKSSGLENKTQPMVTAKGVAWIQKILKEA